MKMTVNRLVTLEDIFLCDRQNAVRRDGADPTTRMTYIVRRDGADTEYHLDNVHMKQVTPDMVDMLRLEGEHFATFFSANYEPDYVNWVPLGDGSGYHRVRAMMQYQNVYPASSLMSGVLLKKIRSYQADGTEQMRSGYPTFGAGHTHNEVDMFNDWSYGNLVE
jgi:hypothetical protein